MFEANIITLGEGKVGKTSLIFRYIDNSFSTTYLSTIGFDSKIKKKKLSNGEQVKIKIFDTAGEERFKSIATNYIKKANGIILVYDITDENSFKNIRKWYEALSEDSNNKSPVILIGNKIDLVNERKISKEDGDKLAKEFGNETETLFYETSCKNGENVHKAIDDLVELIYKKYGNKGNKSSFEIKEEGNDTKINKDKKCCE